MENIATYFAKIGFDINKTQLDALNKTLADVEKRLGSFLAVFDTAITKVEKGLAKSQMAQKRDLDIKNKQAILNSRNLKLEREGLKVQQEKLRTQSLEQRLLNARERVIKTGEAWGFGPTFSSGLKARDRFSNAQSKLAWSFGPDRNMLESGKTAYDAAIAKEEAIQLAKARKIDQEIARDKFRAAMKEQRLQEAQNIVNSRLNERKLRNVARAEKEAYAMEASWEQARIRYDRFQERYNRPKKLPQQNDTSSFLTGGVIGGFARGLLPGLGAAWSVKQINDIQQEVQGQRIALQSITGTAQLGNEAYARLRGMSNEVGFSYRELAPRFNAILSAGKNAGISQAEGEKGFKSIMEYSAVMGLSRPQQEGAALAIEQMLSKQSVQSQELKLQLAQVWPAAEGLMARAAKSTGVIKSESVKDLLKAMEGGGVGVPTIQKFLELVGQEANKGGALQTREQSSIAAQARFQNTWTDFAESLGKSGFDKGIKDIFDGLTKSLTNSNGAVSLLGKSFEIFGGFVKSVLEHVDDLIKGFGIINDKVPALTMAFTALGAALLIAFSPLTFVFGTLYLFFDDFIGFLNGKDSAIGAIIEGFKLLSDDIGNFFSEKTSGVFSSISEKLLDISKIDWIPFKTQIEYIAEFFKSISDSINNISDKTSKINTIFGDKYDGAKVPALGIQSLAEQSPGLLSWLLPNMNQNNPIVVHNNFDIQIQSGSLEEVPTDFRAEIERHSQEMFDQFIINHPDL